MRTSTQFLVTVQLAMWVTYVALLPFSGFHLRPFLFELLASLVMLLAGAIFRRKGQ